MELELALLLLIAVSGLVTFGVFEQETAPWRRLLKWGVITAITLGLHARIGHWASVVLVGLSLLGVAFHVWWCRRNGIHPLKATPRARYYALRGWRLPHDE